MNNLMLKERKPDRKMVSTDEESGELSYTESLSDDDVFYNAESENAPLIKELIAQNQLLKMKEYWNRRLLFLKCLKDPRQRQIPRCQINRVTHPNIPGRAEFIPLPKAIRQARKRRRKLRRRRKREKLLEQMKTL